MLRFLIHLFQVFLLIKLIDALFAFTACETSVAPLGCNGDNKTLFIGVSDMLKFQLTRTVQLLKVNLNSSELEEQWHFLSLERIFYRK
jgi:topoisomerase-4 subunit A